MKETMFKFIFKDKIFPVQPFDKLMNISKRVRNSLIFSVDHTYEIESKVPEENVINFIKYLIDDDEPELTINNITSYETLSCEFEIYESEIETKKREYGEYLITLEGLLNEDKNIKRKYEITISKQLDEYIELYGLELLNKPIETLYNIFVHSEGKFSKHDEIYEYIKEHYKRTQDSNIFILLDFLDGSRMSRQNVEESFSHYSERNNHMPKINFSTLNEYFIRQRQQEEQFLKYEQTIETQQKEITKLLSNESERTQHISKLENQLNNLTKIIDNINNNFNEQQQINQNHIQQLTENNDEQKHKYETIINEQHQEISNLRREEKERTNYISKLENQLNNLTKKIDKFENEMSGQQKVIDNLKINIKELENKNNHQNSIKEEQKSTITKFETQINNLTNSTTSIPKHHNNCQQFETEIGYNVPGLLQRLKNNEKSPFDHLFIASQSSNDIYNIIDPKTNDRFEFVYIGDYIELKLEQSITINGIKIYSSTFSFPKTIDIEINGTNLISIKEANELNGKNKSMTINIKSTECRKIRIINKGPNWDKNNNYIRIKRIELLSNDMKYSRGVFSTLVSETENHDPHKCPVFISSSNFDFNSFYSINSENNTCSFDNENSWFQIEFTIGKAIIKGFRLKRCDLGKMKSYKIICTDDIYKAEENWINLIEIDEKSINEHKTLDIYKFPKPSPPIKFIRIIQTGPNWSDQLFLQFIHLDFFGSYI